MGVGTSTRGRCDRVCGDKEPAPNIVIISWQMNKESLVMHNVKVFAAFRSKELDVCTALDFKTAVPRGAWVARRLSV